MVLAVGSSGYLGADDGELLGHKKVEILNANENTWNITHDYPFVDEHIYYAPIVQHRGAFYVIGGYSFNGPGSDRILHRTIGRFDPFSETWSQAGQLITGRAGHNAIFDGIAFIVVGGYDPERPIRGGIYNTEVCSISDDEMVSCTSQKPEWHGYGCYPELSLVSDSFCQ